MAYESCLRGNKRNSPPSGPPLNAAFPRPPRDEASARARTIAGVIDHVRFEVSELERSATFYDAVFFALGARRMPVGEGSIAWGVDGAVFEIAAADRAPGFGHVALRAAGKAAVEAAHEAGVSAGGGTYEPPGPRPRHGTRAYGAVLRDPDGARVELVSR